MMTPDDRQRRREVSRRARSALERRTEAQQRAGRNGAFYIGAVALAIAVGMALFLFLRGGGPEIGYAVPLLPAAHEPPYVWNQLVEGVPGRVPPTSGHHFDLPHAGWGFKGETLVPERVIHNMEHGGVVIWHQPGDPELAGDVNRLVGELGDQCIVAGAYSDMTYPVAVTVWGRVLPLESFDANQIREFTEAYRGTQGPEAGLCRAELY